MPKDLRHRVLTWYHHFLCHPGATRLEMTLSRTMVWPGMSQDCKRFVRVCDTCQRTKKGSKKYGHLPAKKAEDKPWDILCVDLIGPYTVTIDKKRNIDLTLHAMTFIDPTTGWFEITEIKNKNTVNKAEQVDLVWLTRYPRPRKIITDNGAEFKKDFRTISTDYGVQLKNTTVKNPQANGVLERVHQTICNMLRAKNLAKLEMPEDDPWTAILASVAYAVRSTYHTTLEATPAQLIFGRDMIYPVEYVAEWDVLRQKSRK